MIRKLLATAAALLIGGAGAAQAQTDFPTKPVTMVVPFAAGGPSDVVARVLADELAKIWKQNVVVENKAGGGTVLGAAAVATAKPDGYTMLVVSGSFVVGAAVRSSLPYDTLKDFSGVSLFVEAPFAIVAHPGFPASTLPELIAEAKKRTEKPFTYASSGVASPVHMTAELIQRKTGIKLTHIPYSGEAGAIPDILAGRVDFQIGTWANQRPHVESGKLKLISVLYRTRLPEVPNSPTVHEAIPDLGVQPRAFNAVVIPSKVPRDVAAKIHAGIKTAVETKNYRDRILALGSYPRSSTPEETDNFLRNEVAVWTEVAKAAGIKLD
jgi:tripartite-type tricarboxylate transporter receptor subunit TctC